ncbi:MAG: GlsB/YeaQ/YmgE family stress response membrane protein [Gemmobacter sp.]
MPPILLIVIIGAAAGFLATRFMKVQTDVPTTIVIGIAGAVVGWLILRVLVAITGWVAMFVGAVLGAALLIWAWQTYGPRGPRR